VTEAPTPDPWSLTAEQASAALDRMKPTVLPTDLVTRSADEKWRTAVLNGNGPETKELHSLIQAKLAAGDKLETVLAHGDAAVPLIPEVTYSGALSSRQILSTIKDFRERGHSDAHIREFYDETGTIDRVIHEEAKQLAREWFSPDSEWRARYLAGGPAERRQMDWLLTVLGKKVVDVAAA
jgi:hypothetical protein